MHTTSLSRRAQRAALTQLALCQSPADITEFFGGARPLAERCFGHPRDGGRATNAVIRAVARLGTHWLGSRLLTEALSTVIHLDDLEAGSLAAFLAYTAGSAETFAPPTDAEGLVLAAEIREFAPRYRAVGLEEAWSMDRGMSCCDGGAHCLPPESDRANPAWQWLDDLHRRGVMPLPDHRVVRARLDADGHDAMALLRRYDLVAMASLALDPDLFGCSPEEVALVALVHPIGVLTHPACPDSVRDRADDMFERQRDLFRSTAEQAALGLRFRVPEVPDARALGWFTPRSVIDAALGGRDVGLRRAARDAGLHRAVRSHLRGWIDASEFQRLVDCRFGGKPPGHLIAVGETPDWPNRQSVALSGAQWQRDSVEERRWGFDDPYLILALDRARVRRSERPDAYGDYRKLVDRPSFLITSLDSVHGAVRGGWTIETLRTGHDLERNAERMDNCTASHSYVEGTERGELMILVVSRPGQRTTNVELVRAARQRWRLGQAASRDNEPPERGAVEAVVWLLSDLSNAAEQRAALRRVPSSDEGVVDGHGWLPEPRVRSAKLRRRPGGGVRRRSAPERARRQRQRVA